MSRPEAIPGEGTAAGSLSSRSAAVPPRRSLLRDVILTPPPGTPISTAPVGERGYDVFKAGTPETALPAWARRMLAGNPAAWAE